DFRSAWLTALTMLLKPDNDGFFIVFADANQTLYSRGWELPEAADVYPLTVNCRSTLEILERVQPVYGECTSGRGVHGPRPSYTLVKTLDDAVDEAQTIVARLLDDENLEPRQVVALCIDRVVVDRLRGKSVGSCVLVEPGKAGVGVETVHRFKGLEAE